MAERRRVDCLDQRRARDRDDSAGTESAHREVPRRDPGRAGVIDVSTNAASVSVRYTDAPKLVATTVVQTFRRIGAGLQRHAVREKLNGQVLERRTGTLARALFSQIWLDGKDAVLTFGADKAKAKGAAIQEYGGTIRPTHAQHLAIPLDAARTAKGVARLSAREFIAHPESLGFESTFVN